MSEQKTGGRFIKGYFYNGVKISKWENERAGGGKSVSYSIEKSYKDKESGEYKQSSTFFSNDLDALLQCIIAMKSESIKEILPKAIKAEHNIPDDNLEDEVPF